MAEAGLLSRRFRTSRGGLAMPFPWSLLRGLAMVSARKEKEGVKPFNRLALDKSSYESTELSRECLERAQILNAYLRMAPIHGGIYRKPKGTISHSVRDRGRLVP